MSVTGDALGLAVTTAKATAASTFRGAHPNIVGLMPAFNLAVEQAASNVMEARIEAVATAIASGVTPLAVVAAVDLVAGQPVFVDSISGQLKLASAAGFAASFVAGLVQSTTLAAFAAPLATTTLALSDWTAIIGTASLTKGARYFLGAVAGTLSSTAPTTPGQSVVSVGLALSTTQLEITPTPPILL